MKNRNALLFPALVLLGFLAASSTTAQIPMSGGSYSQNFDSLGSAAANWTNNSTLPGWYSSKGSGDSTNHLASTGSSTTGGIYSYGTSGVSNFTDRALGSIGASSITYTYGVRFINNTAATQTNITISYLGEQWRSGNTNTSQTLSFSYAVSGSPITNAHSAAAWINLAPLSFVSPNRSVFASVVLAGVTVAPGQEIFLRWQDVDDAGFDNALAVDDLVVTFSAGSNSPPSAPTIITQPQSQMVTAGAGVTFTVIASGNPAPAYQWQFNNTNLPGATSSSLTLNSVTTNQSGNYFVVITNSAGSTNSQIVTLTVFPPPSAVAGFTLMNYNTHGNFVSDWTTNSPQVQAIGRQVQYLNPDIITFQEIPMTNSGWSHMGEFVSVYRPGFYLATNSGTDNFIRSAILSRFPITRSTSWLDGASLTNFGYDGKFTRDLFEAQIAVPGFPQPLHVFTTHLKSGTSLSADAQRRAAEASAISNFFVHAYLTTNSLQPYLLTGDMNEDILFPATGSQQPIQRLTNSTGLVLTTPTNQFNGSSLTFSIQAASMTRRYDYIMPCDLLFANIASRQVFRSDLLPSPPPPLLATDSETASDHIPVLMTFNNPYDKPFQLLSFTRSNLTVTLNWQSVPGQPYRVESSTNLTAWSTLANNLVATGSIFTYATNLNDAARFFRVYRVP
jgi:endonuclease/exonuclease/phosphatase family metal-dependent hydrolase